MVGNMKKKIAAKIKKNRNIIQTSAPQLFGEHIYTNTTHIILFEIKILYIEVTSIVLSDRVQSICKVHDTYYKWYYIRHDVSRKDIIILGDPFYYYFFLPRGVIRLYYNSFMYTWFFFLSPEQVCAVIKKKFVTTQNHSRSVFGNVQSVV